MLRFDSAENFLLHLFSKKPPWWQSSADMFTLKRPQFESLGATVLPDHLPSTMHVTWLSVLGSTLGPHSISDSPLLVKIDDQERYRRIGRFTVQLPMKSAKSYLERLEASVQSQISYGEAKESISSFSLD